jgi:hypothetical protein
VLRTLLLRARIGNPARNYGRAGLPALTWVDTPLGAGDGPSHMGRWVAKNEQEDKPYVEQISSSVWMCTRIRFGSDSTEMVTDNPVGFKLLVCANQSAGLVPFR